MKEAIKNNKGKIVTGTGVSGIIIAIVLNFGTISDELQEWWYMANGERGNPSSEKNYYLDRHVPDNDYETKSSEKK